MSEVELPEKDPKDRQSFVEGLCWAGRIVCHYCERDGLPEANDRGVLVHGTYSSRDLRTEHECKAIRIYEAVWEMQAKMKAEKKK